MFVAASWLCRPNRWGSSLHSYSHIHSLSNRHKYARAHQSLARSHSQLQLAHGHNQKAATAPSRAPVCGYHLGESADSALAFGLGVPCRDAHPASASRPRARKLHEWRRGLRSGAPVLVAAARPGGPRQRRRGGGARSRLGLCGRPGLCDDLITMLGTSFSMFLRAAVRFSLPSEGNCFIADNALRGGGHVFVAALPAQGFVKPIWKT